MKSQKGITLISLTVYIIALLVVIATLATLSGVFFSSYRNSSNKVPTLTEYTKFTSYISEEINKKDIQVAVCKEEDVTNEGKRSYLVFSNNAQYIFIEKNASIYKNKVKICRNVEKCKFSLNDSRDRLTVDMKFKGEDFPRNITFTLNR